MSILSLSFYTSLLKHFSNTYNGFVLYQSLILNNQVMYELKWKVVEKNYPWLDLNYNGFLECHVSV